jgi:KUP system potassium uptake protein
LMLENPDAAVNPFYKLAPDWAVLPLVILATLATVIASQALISGAFSITMQAVQLGFTPRLQILHTSPTEYGQIYMPAVNWALMIGCVALVVIFRTSSALAAAYGIAVTSTMAITTITFYIVMRDKWKWSLAAAGGLTAFFLVVDLAFLGANSLKILNGGWMPIALAIFIFTVMTTWKRGQRALHGRVHANAQSLDEFLERISRDQPHRVPGIAVFMSDATDSVPSALLLNYGCNQTLHETIILLHVATKLVPTVTPKERGSVHPLCQEFYAVRLDYGFMEHPNIPKALASLDSADLVIDPDEATYFLGRQTILPSAKDTGLSLWREKIYALLSRNATSSTAYFCLPPSRVVEMVTHVEI